MNDKTKLITISAIGAVCAVVVVACAVVVSKVVPAIISAKAE